MCAISPDGSLVATGSSDKTASVSDAATGDVIYTAKHEGWVRSSVDRRCLMLMPRTDLEHRVAFGRKSIYVNISGWHIDGIRSFEWQMVAPIRLQDQ